MHETAQRVVGNVAQCSVCYEAYLVTADMSDEQVTRFVEWNDRHGRSCTQAPFIPLTQYTLSALARLQPPGH